MEHAHAGVSDINFIFTFFASNEIAEVDNSLHVAACGASTERYSPEAGRLKPDHHAVMPLKNTGSSSCVRAVRVNREYSHVGTNGLSDDLTTIGDPIAGSSMSSAEGNGLVCIIGVVLAEKAKLQSQLSSSHQTTRRKAVEVKVIYRRFRALRERNSVRKEDLTLPPRRSVFF